jgi:4-hydroxyphenylpyruvate dioxygenase
MDVNLSHTATASIPTFNHETCRNFSAKHGLAVRAITIEVDDAELAQRGTQRQAVSLSNPP